MALSHFYKSALLSQSNPEKEQRAPAELFLKAKNLSI